MVFFQSAESAERNASTEAFLESGRAMLSDPAVVGNLQEGEANDLLRIVNNDLFVPNIRHGEIRKPFGVRPGSIPIFAARPDDSFEVSAKYLLEMNAEQTDNAREYLELAHVSNSAIYAILKLVKERQVDASPRITDFDDSTRAVVGTNGALFHYQQGDGQTVSRRFSNLPIVQHRYEEGTNPTGGLILIHELVHIRQRLQRPVYNPAPELSFDMSIKDELEAYRVSSLAMAALHYASDNPAYYKNEAIIDTITLLIESSRYEVNKDETDPYALSEELYDTTKQQFLLAGLYPPKFLSQPGISATIEPSQR